MFNLKDYFKLDLIEINDVILDDYFKSDSREITSKYRQDMSYID